MTKPNPGNCKNCSSKRAYHWRRKNSVESVRFGLQKQNVMGDGSIVGYCSDANVVLLYHMWCWRDAAGRKHPKNTSKNDDINATTTVRSTCHFFHVCQLLARIAALLAVPDAINSRRPQARRLVFLPSIPSGPPTNRKAAS